MFPKINPADTKAWQALEAHAEEMKEVHMQQLFETDPQRFEKFSFTF